MGRDKHLPATMPSASFYFVAWGLVITPAPNAAAAEPQATVAPKASIPLEDAGWALISPRGQHLLAGSSLTLAFDPEHDARGIAGCDNYGGHDDLRLEGVRCAHG